MRLNPIIVIGSGLGGLVAGALLARYGRRVIVLESHSLPGGAAHAFRHRWQDKVFTFDSGPSFFSGLGHPASANPLTQVLTVLGEKVPSVPYDPLGYYHLPEGKLPIYSQSEPYRQAIEPFAPGASAQLAQLEARLMKIYRPLKAVPALALRADWQLLPLLIQRYPAALAQMLPTLPDLGQSLGAVMADCVRHPFLKRLLDLECFLLSGLPADQTAAPEMAFMFGERFGALNRESAIDYPIGGSGALVDALVRGLQRWGGELRLGSHVRKIVVENGRAKGVVLSDGTCLQAETVISNASLWDTYGQLLAGEDIGDRSFIRSALQTPAIESFMHLHLAIRSEGLEDLAIHHVVVKDNEQPLSAPGNTCMISIPTVLDPQQAPPGYHTVHVYSLEPFENWAAWSGSKANRTAGKIAGKIIDPAYAELKQQRAEPLFQALERVIPDVRERVVLSLIGTPLTHSRFLRRYQGTYGPAIAAGAGRFPSCKTPIKGLYRVGDSTLPGIGVPAVAASGILCANHLVSLKESVGLLEELTRQIESGDYGGLIPVGTDLSWTDPKAKQPE